MPLLSTQWTHQLPTVTGGDGVGPLVVDVRSFRQILTPWAGTLVLMVPSVSSSSRKR